MGNSTQQNDANGGTPLAEPTGSQDCYNCDRVTGRIPGMVYCDLHEEWVNDTDVACADFCGANAPDQARAGSPSPGSGCSAIQSKGDKA